MYGKSGTSIHATIEFEGTEFEYSKNMVRSSGRKTHNKKALNEIVEIFHEKYISDEKQNDIPIFANYGTNRLVLDIPLRIRTHHTFDIYSAFEKAIENKIDFRTFFEWYEIRKIMKMSKKSRQGI